MIRRIFTNLSWRIGFSHPQTFLTFLEKLPPEILKGFRRAAFRETLRLAKDRSPYYRQKFREYGIDIRKARDPKDLGDFYLTPEDVRVSPAALLCGRPDIAIESSGTTGHAARIFLSHHELEYNAKQSAVMKAVYRISKEDRILSTFDYGFCLDGLLASKGIPYWDAFGVCVGRIDPAEIYRKLSAYRFNIIMSGTPWLARLTEVAQAEGRPYPLKLLVGGGGGGILSRTRERIESFWGAPLCMTYALTEAGTVLGFECLRRDGYHLNEFDFFIEILDPDAQGYGEVVITTVNRTVMPIIRYRTKDIARFIEEDCPCGLPFRRLSPLRGRSDEIVASVWGNVHPDFFEKVLGSVAGIEDDWQVVLHEIKGKQTFQFRLEVQNGAPSQKEITARILSLIEREHPLAWQAYRQGLADVGFIFVPKGSLRKGRKLLRLLDERRQSMANSK